MFNSTNKNETSKKNLSNEYASPQSSLSGSSGGGKHQNENNNKQAQSHIQQQQQSSLHNDSEKFTDNESDYGKKYFKK